MRNATQEKQREAATQEKHAYSLDAQLRTYPKHDYRYSGQPPDITQYSPITYKLESLATAGGRRSR